MRDLGCGRCPRRPQVGADWRLVELRLNLARARLQGVEFSEAWGPGAGSRC
jgi:hypothetical protein